MPFLMPSEEETRIVLKFQDGQKDLTLDATEVDTILFELQSKDLPEDISFEDEFISTFKKRYNRKLSKSGVAFLCHIKRQMMEKVKKNLYLPDEVSDSSDSQDNSTNEDISSSSMSNQPSEPMKS